MKTKKPFRFIISNLVSVAGGILLYSGVRDLLPQFGGTTAVFAGLVILMIGLYTGWVD